MKAIRCTVLQSICNELEILNCKVLARLDAYGSMFTLADSISATLQDFNIKYLQIYLYRFSPAAMCQTNFKFGTNSEVVISCDLKWSLSNRVVLICPILEMTGIQNDGCWITVTREAGKSLLFLETFHFWLFVYCLCMYYYTLKIHLRDTACSQTFLFVKRTNCYLVMIIATTKVTGTQ